VSSTGFVLHRIQSPLTVLPPLPLPHNLLRYPTIYQLLDPGLLLNVDKEPKKTVGEEYTQLLACWTC